METKYHNIAVIYGSDSSEWEVSCWSGEFVSSRIDGSLYNIYEIFARFGRWQLVAYRMKDSVRTAIPEQERPEIDKTDFSVQVGGRKVKFDFAYLMQHGTPGENGLMQGYLEMLSVPFSVILMTYSMVPSGFSDSAGILARSSFWKGSMAYSLPSISNDIFPSIPCLCEMPKARYPQPSLLA